MLKNFNNLFDQTKTDKKKKRNPPANAGTWVRALVPEDPTYCRTTNPVHHNY